MNKCRYCKLHRATELLCPPPAVCFHTQLFTHLCPSPLPRRFPAHISVFTQDYPTFYQAGVMFMNILSKLSRPVCLHTGESDYKYRCYKKKKNLSTQSVDMEFCLLFHLVALCVTPVFLWLLLRILFAGRTKEQPGEFLRHLSPPVGLWLVHFIT